MNERCDRMLVIGLKQAGGWVAGNDKPVAEAFKNAAAFSKAVLLDFSAVDHLETVALASLLRWIRKASESHIVLGLCNLPPQVRVVAQILGIHHSTPIFNDPAEAERVLIPAVVAETQEAAAAGRSTRPTRRRRSFLPVAQSSMVQNSH